MSRHACASARRCVCRQLKFFSTRFVISSGSETLSDASLSTACSSCCFVIVRLNGMGFGYMCVSVMSEVSASDNDESAGRRTSLNWIVFSYYYYLLRNYFSKVG